MYLLIKIYVFIHYSVNTRENITSTYKYTIKYLLFFITKNVDIQNICFNQQFFPHDSLSFQFLETESQSIIWYLPKLTLIILVYFHCALFHFMSMTAAQILNQKKPTALFCWPAKQNDLSQIQIIQCEVIKSILESGHIQIIDLIG